MAFESKIKVEVKNLRIEFSCWFTSHEYTLLYTGKGAPVSFLIFDGDSTTTPPTLYPSWYGDNVGSLTVKIYLNLW